MPWEVVTYRRAELFEQVWAKPMRDVAKAYRVSDVALRKTCKKLNVPLPPQGHWNRPPGRREPVPKLPSLAHGQPEEISHQRPVPAQAIPEELSPEDIEWRSFLTRPEAQYREVEPPFKITVPGTTGRLHKLAEEARKQLCKAYVDRQGFVRWSKLSIHAGKSQIDRYARILSCLFQSVEAAGEKVKPSATPNHYEHIPAHFLVRGERISFSVRERLARFPHVPSINDYFPQQYEFRASGRLRLTIGGRTWEDSAKVKVEDQINEVFASIFWQAENAGVERARLEERRRLDRVAEARQHAIRLAEEEKRTRKMAEEKEEERRKDELMQLAQDWEKAIILRRFVAAVRWEAARRFGTIEAESSAAMWLKWAAGVADRLDPLPNLFGDEQ